MLEIVAFAGVLLGVLCRTLLPFVVKMQDSVSKGSGFAWNWAYAYTAVSAFFTSFVIAILAFPAFNIPAGSLSLFYVFLLSFGYGWGLNDLYNKVLVDLR